MNASRKKKFLNKNTLIEENENLKKNNGIYNTFNYNTYQNNLLNELSNFNKSVNQLINEKSNLSRNYFLKRNLSHSYMNGKENLLILKKEKQPINKSFNLMENSTLLNDNSYENINYFRKKKSPIFNNEKINNSNSINSYFSNAIINKILGNKNRNNKLKNKFENLLDLTLNNNNKSSINNNSYILPKFNNIETQKINKIERTIEKIRNKNKKEIFKKQIEINILGRKKISTNKSIKKDLSQNFLGKGNKISLYKSINLKDINFCRIKRNKSFIDNFINKRKNIIKNNNIKNILNTQDIYRPNSKVDFSKKIIENEKKERKNSYNFKNLSKIKFRLNHLRTDLKFF